MKPEGRKNRVVKRFGAFLRLYGPKGKPTNAVLVLGHDPEPGTPRGFLAELEVEDKYERHGRANGVAVRYMPGLAPEPRVSLPSLGSTVRIFDMNWKPAVSRPPLRCAGLRQMTPWQSSYLAVELRQERYKCECCGAHHLKGKRHG